MSEEVLAQASLVLVTGKCNARGVAETVLQWGLGRCHDLFILRGTQITGAWPLSCLLLLESESPLAGLPSGGSRAFSYCTPSRGQTQAHAGDYTGTLN